MEVVATQRYIHNSEVHNMTSPDIIVPHIIDLLNPRSVADVGCGTGTFLKAFYDRGITNIKGYDGSWVDKKELHIPQELFEVSDLEKPLEVKENFDIVLCLEVAEHLKIESADIIVNSLVQLGKIIVFSAAIPNQGGQNHLNEQSPVYWQQKFAKHNYTYYDVLRPSFWNNKNIDWWYKQNMFLVVHNSVDLGHEIKQYRVEGEPSLWIHPELFDLHIKRHQKIAQKFESVKANLRNLKEGRSSYSFYMRTLIKKLIGNSQ